MKIGVNTLFLIPGEVGGTETYLRQTLLAMAEHYPDVSLVLFTNRENLPVLRNDLSRFKQVDFVELDFRAMNRYSRIIREQLELPVKVRKHGVDVLWSPGYTAPFSCKCPQVVTIPDMQYKTFPQDLTFLARVVTDILVRIAARRCKKVIAISNFARDEICRYAGIDSGKIDVVYLAADPAFGILMQAEKRVAMLSSFMPVDRPYILSVANTYPHKNIHTLVRAFGEIMVEVPHNLVLVGNPRLGEREVEAALNLVPDRNRVVRLQNLTVDKLVALYQGCDAFVFPSLYEGFGLPVLEAMTAGVPVIAVRTASVPEVGGDCIFYSDGRNAGGLAATIRKVLGMASEERRLRCEQASLRAKTFSWKVTAGRTLEVLRSAVTAA
jgi:glycosyltransferase involved in cell wall biosynthesis